MPDDLPVLPFAAPAEWEAWLAEHHVGSPGVWLKYAKKNSGVASVTYAEALDVALCFGWIDGQTRSFDRTYYLQRYTPRRPRSIWSKINRVKALALIEAGRMQPAGLREVERAQADGRWEAAYDSPSTATVPDDLQAALDADASAAAFFATLKGQNRYAILHRIQTARTPATREKRIREFVAMLAEHRTLHP